MQNKITVKELNGIKSLLKTQDNLIFRFEQFSKQIKEPQLRIEYQKFYASAQSHKNKLLSALEIKSE